MNADWMLRLIELVLSPDWDRAARRELKAARKARDYARVSWKDEATADPTDPEFVGEHLPHALRYGIDLPAPGRKPLRGSPGWFENLQRTYEDER